MEGMLGRGGVKKTKSAMTPKEFKDARETLGLTRDEMADMLSLTPNSVTRMEHGRQVVMPMNAFIIRRALERQVHSDRTGIPKD